MSKVIKLKQAQVESIVKSVVFEHLGEYQPTMADAQVQEETPIEEKLQVGVAKGKDGRHYIMNVKTGEILGIK